MNTVTVVIADDQPLVRAGIARIIEADDAITLVGEAGDGAEAVTVSMREQPDVVLMDIRMPLLDGIESTRRLRDAGCPSRVLVLTTFGLDDYVIDALRAGAQGFLLKEAPPERILAAIHELAAGRAVLDPAVTRPVITALGSTRRAATPLSATLTAREEEVLGLLARGLSNAEIAAQLIVGEGTVKTHLAHILSKLGVRDRLQAVVAAYDAGLV